MRSSWLPFLAVLLTGCGGSTGGGTPDAAADVAIAFPDAPGPSCVGGVDKDGDGYGAGCPAGPDCNDSDPAMNAGAKETCDGKDNNCNNDVDEGVKNACGTCDPGCSKLGTKPFETEPAKDPGVKDANGVGLDPNGDLVLDKTKTNFNYMWIANSLDTLGAAGGCNWASEPTYNQALNPKCRGTVSKVDTVTMKEVARYFSITCSSKPGQSGCVDLHGKPITAEFVHAPSRTAVDYNFDVWVANRAFAGQPSATKIANDLADCIDRNKNGKIDTSKDQDGDGKINPDCDGDGLPDSLATVCAGALAGKPPEFVGNDDECILFTVNYGDSNDYGRSICLDTGIDIGASNAWVGTYNHPGQNRYYKIDGKSGALAGPFDLPAGHASYGCVVDSQRILWSADFAGTIVYLNTVNPTQVGPLLSPPWTPKGFYGITVDGSDRIWAGGWSSGRTYRYTPKRTSFADLAAGTWLGAKQPAGFDYSRGIAADLRGKVWVAV
ncbi:MAG: MopE-related protein, partial [Acidobacteriota bacterium]